MASQWRLDHLTAAFVEMAAAVVTMAGRAAPTDLVATQGHVLSVADLVGTLVIEATIHHVDMTAHLDRVGPQLESLVVTRATLDHLLGRPAPDAWSSTRWVCRDRSGRDEVLDDLVEVLEEGPGQRDARRSTPGHAAPERPSS